MNDCAIVLTTCILRNTEQESMKMENIYRKNITEWLQKYDHDIYVIESSGKGFDIQHPRYYEYVCDIKLEDLPIASSSTAESLSIINFLEQNDEILKYKYIFKITGRYFIDNLSKPVEDALYYFQRPNNGIYHCEVMCFDRRVFKSFFESVIYNCFTKQMWITEHQTKDLFKFCIPFENRFNNVFKIPRGGDNIIVECL